MKNYYLHLKGIQYGPFSIDQLAQQNIQSDTSVWTEGLEAWIPASELPELQDLLRKTPPPFATAPAMHAVYDEPEVGFTEKTGFRMGRLLGWPGLIVLGVSITAIILYFNKSSYAAGSEGISNDEVIRSKTPEELRAELLRREQDSPGEYISAQYNNWENLLSQRVIEIDFTNKATMANYKDIIVRIHFLTKTQTELGTTDYTIFKYLPAGGSMTHKMKLQQPAGTKNVSVSILGVSNR